MMRAIALYVIILYTNDRTQMYESWEQEKYKASHDSLTGL